MKRLSHTQPISPEKYIRTRVRTLPIGPCYINDDWRHTGAARLTVTRIHINGNVTFANYLVDLFCLGLLESNWFFNIPGPDFREYIDDQNLNTATDFKIIKTDYVLVHNIIYGAIEFASDFDFNPHKTFEITRNLLEEDDERIPLLDIEFGYKGKPLYLSNVKNPYQKNRVIAHLDKRCGKGNYYTIDDQEAGDFFYEMAKADGKIPDYQDPSVKFELISTFIKQSGNLKKTFNSKTDSFIDTYERAVEIYYEYVVNEEILTKARETIRSLFDFTITKEVFSEEMLFGKSRPERRSEIRIAAEEAWRQLGRESEQESGHNYVKTLKQKYPDVPIFRYLDFRFLEFTSGMKELQSELEQYVIQHPDYLPIIYLFTISWLMNRPEQVERKMSESLHLKVAGIGRKSFCRAEAAVYSEALTIHYIINKEYVLMQELKTYLENSMPELMPKKQILMANVSLIINVLEWCENWMKDQSVPNMT